MIVANLATYPPRREGLIQVVERLAPQLDKLNVVLNEYEDRVSELARFDNVDQLLPPHDTKDAGKFFPDVSGAEYVFLVDDDLVFPYDFVPKTLEAMRPLGSGYIGGYHVCLYEKPRPGFGINKMKRWLRYEDDFISDYRKIFSFRAPLDRYLIVDQVGSGTAIMAADDLPPYAYMKDSQKFVDVRLARWCFEKGIRPVGLPRPKGWLSHLSYDETIYEGFTKANPAHVAQEILSYAFKVPGRGTDPMRTRGTAIR